jgi:methyl-accepting chemotaxis protein
MKLKQSGSISTRFFAILLILFAIGQGVGSFLFLKSIRSGFMDALHARVERQIKQASGVLGEPAVTLNTSLIESYLNETLNDQDILAMKVMDRDGNTIKEQGAPGKKSGAFVKTEKILFLGEPVGSLRIEYAAKTIDGSMRKSVMLILIYQVAMLAVVAFVLIRLFTAYVKAPVERLNKAISSITAGDLTVEIRADRDDEIGTIANGVKFLVERLAKTVSRLDSISEKVVGTVHELEDVFGRVKGTVEGQNRSTEMVSMALESAGVAQQQILTNTDQLLHLSGDNLSTLLQIQANSEEIAGTTDNLTTNVQSSYSALMELARSAKEISEMAGEVNAFVADASSSIEEVYRSVKSAELLINESSKLTTQATSVISDKGMDAISHTTEGMQRIGKFIDALMASIEGLGERSRDIGKVLEVISDVTDKSRLLSLNAQIIAAQAGEHGKGFAVVAEEMKQLSDKASSSTQEISKIVNVIMKEIAEVVAATRSSVTVVRNGEAVVERTAGVLNEILATSLQTTDLANDIERASMEQNNGLRQVVVATEQIREKIQEVSKATSEQEKSTDFLLKALDPIKDGMELTRRSTTEQANSSRFISGNLDIANQKNQAIASASAEQQQLNIQVQEAIGEVVNMGQATVGEIERLAPHVAAMREDMESLRAEMSGFRINKSLLATDEVMVAMPPEPELEVAAD